WDDPSVRDWGAAERGTWSMHQRLIRGQLAVSERCAFSRKCIVMTGGTSGIGRQTLKLLLSEPGNFTVFLLARSSPRVRPVRGSDWRSRTLIGRASSLLIAPAGRSCAGSDGAGLMWGGLGRPLPNELEPRPPHAPQRPPGGEQKFLSTACNKAGCKAPIL